MTFGLSVELPIWPFYGERCFLAIQIQTRAKSPVACSQLARIEKADYQSGENQTRTPVRPRLCTGNHKPLQAGQPMLLSGSQPDVGI